MDNQNENTVWPPSPTPSPSDIPPPSLTKMSEAIKPEASQFVVFGAIGLFILALLGVFVFAGGSPQEASVPSEIVEPADNKVAESVAIVKNNSTVETPIAIETPAYIPPTPSTGVRSESAAPLTPATLAYDLNQDKVLDNQDVAIVAQMIDQRQSLAVTDLDSNGIVDIADLALIRAALKEYPVAYYDINLDKKLDGADISTVAQLIDERKYLAILDFNSDGIVDISDLAMVREGVASAGTVSR